MKKTAVVMALMLVWGTVMISGCTEIPGIKGDSGDSRQDSDNGSGDNCSG